MLDACHLRVKKFSSLLGKVDDHVQQRGYDDEARQAVQRVMQYFDHAGPVHHADEENALFPALLQHPELPTAVRRVILTLQSEHRTLENLWQSIRAKLVLANMTGTWQADRKKIDSFAQQYAQHIRCEEQEVLPYAQRLLDPTVLAAVGLDMEKRRGVVVH
jgi:hemerythrin-like domain-containing protein